jgi:hypothetical protein
MELNEWDHRNEFRYEKQLPALPDNYMIPETYLNKLV